MSNAPDPKPSSDLGVLTYTKPQPEFAAARRLLIWMIINLAFGLPLAGLAVFFVGAFVYYLGSDPWVGFALLDGFIIAIPATILLNWAHQCSKCRRGILQGDPCSAARAATLCRIVMAVTALSAIVAILFMAAFHRESGVLLGLGILLACLAALIVAVRITLRSLRDTERSLRADMPATPRFTEQIWKED